MADPGGALCGSACWRAAYQNYLKYQQLADTAGDLYHGFLKEYASAQAAAYYNWSQQDAVQNLVHSDNMAAARFGDLVRNGYYGTEAAASAAADASGGAMAPIALAGGLSELGSAGLAQGFVSNGPPAGERLEYTAQNPIDAEQSSYVNLASPKSTNHILYGDASGGGHSPGLGIPGKTEFPADWSNAKIMHMISDIATDPNITPALGRFGRWIMEGMREDVNIRVVIAPDWSDIITGFPTNLPRNP